MLNVVQPHHYSKKEKSTCKRTTSWAVLEEHSRNKRQIDVGVTEKRETKEGDGGYDYGSTTPSIKN